MRENDLLTKLKRDNNQILVYGAGMVGSLVFHRLLDGGIPKERIAFAVSRKEKGNDTFLGCEIHEILECDSYFGEVHIIVSTLQDAQKEIIRTLQENHYYEYDLIDDLLFEEMEKAYVDQYNQEHPVKEEARDILFMASDNNCSSGAFLCMVDLNRELNRRGISTLVVLPAYGSGEELLQTNHIEYTYILSRDWLIRDGSAADGRLRENEGAVSAIRELIRKCCVKLIHNNTTYTYVGAVAAREENLPVVWHLREYIKEQGYWFYDEEEAFRLINASDAVIIVSDYVGKCYGKLCAPIVHKIYDGINTKTFFCKDHALMAKEKIRILMPGMITPLKGQRQLLEAALLLKQQGYDRFEVVFIGNEDPAYAGELKAFVTENGMEGMVSFHGRSREIAKWYLWADLVVVCSGAEAFGRVTVEAQLSGCLVIGADQGATTELIEDKETGYLYRYGNSDDLAAKIVDAVKDKSGVQKIAVAGKNKAVKIFTKEHNAEEVIKVYDQIRKDRGNGREDALQV